MAQHRLSGDLFKNVAHIIPAQSDAAADVINGDILFKVFVNILNGCFYGMKLRRFRHGCHIIVTGLTRQKCQKALHIAADCFSVIGALVLIFLCDLVIKPYDFRIGGFYRQASRAGIDRSVGNQAVIFAFFGNRIYRMQAVAVHDSNFTCGNFCPLFVRAYCRFSIDKQQKFGIFMPVGQKLNAGL